MQTIQNLLNIIESANTGKITASFNQSHTQITRLNTAPPLFESQAEYDAFCARHNSQHPPEVDIAAYTGDAYLGIDAGSTTTKLALIAPDGGLLYT